MSAGAPAPTAFARFRRSLTRAEWTRLAGVALAIIGLHVIGWLTLLVFVAPQGFDLGDKVFGVGIGVTAYVLGMRHAFDADHIAVIDNTTRKLMEDGQRPLTVGFWFALGHSSIVFGLALLFSVGVKALVGQVENESSGLQQFTSVWGTLVSGSFLYVIAIINLIALTGIIRVFRSMRRGKYNEAQLEKHLSSRGLMARILRPLTKSITKPWQMYPIGLLMGFGFDTATEVALLFLAASGAAGGLPWYAVLCLPVLFAAGMTLFDTADGTFMNFAYGWAFSKPVRKIYYNLTITGLSIAVALLIGTVELLAILAEKLELTGGFWEWVMGIDLNLMGFIIVGLFVVTWLAALAIWRFGRIEDKWSARLREAGESAE